MSELEQAVIDACTTLTNGGFYHLRQHEELYTLLRAINDLRASLVTPESRERYRLALIRHKEAEMALQEAGRGMTTEVVFQLYDEAFPEQADARRTSQGASGSAGC